VFQAVNTYGINGTNGSVGTLVPRGPYRATRPHAHILLQAVNTNGINGAYGTPKEVFQAVSTTRQTSQGKRATLVARTAGSSN